MKIKVNRRDSIELDNISKIVVSKTDIRIYKKSGYPRILKSRDSYNTILMRILNTRISNERLLEFKNERTIFI